MTTNGTRYDVYQKITDQIVAAIEKGATHFEMPWHRDVARTFPTNVLTGNPYNGVNILALWASAELSGYETGLWGTFKQWRLLDASVRKGEKASAVVFYKETRREVWNKDTGKKEMERYLFARSTAVFNADQVEGWEPEKPEIDNPVQIVEQAEAFVVGTGADIRYGGDSAYYNPKADYIQIPAQERFTGTATSTPTESYYATQFHELTHWTGHKSRCDRDLSQRFGEEAYAMEELVAELGAAFLCSDLRITNVPRPDHAGYLANWLKVLKSDKRAIFSASRKAGDAKDFLVSLQPSVKTAMA